MKCILIVEDTEDDVFFLRRALKTAKIEVPIQVVIDGQQALDYVEGKGVYADRSLYPEPCWVLLDLNLPYVPGLEVLKQIRSHPQHGSLPVVILTSSLQDSDVIEAARLGVDDYLIKPVSAAKLTEISRSRLA
jgi:CheY-like chemotaxis protein